MPPEDVIFTITRVIVGLSRWYHDYLFIHILNQSWNWDFVLLILHILYCSHEEYLNHFRFSFWTMIRPLRWSHAVSWNFIHPLNNLTNHYLIKLHFEQVQTCWQHNMYKQVYNTCIDILMGFRSHRFIRVDLDRAPQLVFAPRALCGPVYTTWSCWAATVPLSHTDTVNLNSIWRRQMINKSNDRNDSREDLLLFIKRNVECHSKWKQTACYESQCPHSLVANCVCVCVCAFNDGAVVRLLPTALLVFVALLFNEGQTFSLPVSLSLCLPNNPPQ